MTRDEIMAMSAGRELNRLVSLHIFKMDKVDFIPYSEQIGPAGEVVKQMKRNGWGITISSWGDDETMGEDPFLVTFGFLGGPSNFMSINLPEAICKAALLTVLEEVTT